MQVTGEGVPWFILKGIPSYIGEGWKLCWQLVEQIVKIEWEMKSGENEILRRAPGSHRYLYPSDFFRITP